MSTATATEPTGCCPPFDPAVWDEKSFTWENKRFVKDTVRTFFYMPLNFGSVMKRLLTKVNQAGAAMPDWLCLADHVSKWTMHTYLAVDKEVPHAENITLSGQYLSKVYEGPYRDTAKWCKNFEAFAESKGFKIEKWYMWYTTCPKCAKKFGKNYVVIICKVGG
jgi:hypothetical protein